MTNGTIVNIGGYGKGFGNGMSGGNAYQYDLTGAIVKKCSEDSIQMFPISENTELAKGHEEALKSHLQKHFLRTGSKKAKELIKHWEENRNYFYYAIPNSLKNYHRGENILKAMSRKQMLEEMSIAVARKNAKIITEAYKNNKDLFKGEIPTYGETSSSLISNYVVITGLWNRAIENAKKRTKTNIENTARKLIITEDKKFMDTLYKDMKEALKNFNDEALAHLLANKRVEDYKESNLKREVADTNALGSTVWVLECDRVNATHLSKLNSLEEELAAYYLKILIHALAA